MMKFIDPLIKRFRKVSEAVKPYILYPDCHALPLPNFIECLINNNLNFLCSSGSAPEDVLIDHWRLIYAEYLDLIEDDSVKDSQGLIRDIYLMRSRFERVENLVMLLSLCHYPELVKELRRLGFPYQFDVKNMTQYKADLHNTYNQAKAILIQVKQKENQLQRLQEKSAGKQPTMADFNAVLISLCEHFKYHIKPHDLTTGQYAEMIKRVKEYALQQEAMQRKQKNPKAN